MIRQLFHFLGGIRLAIFLICFTALMAISGTFIESVTESHLHAAHFTYSSFWFKALLWAFFVNILFAALRRWPFKKRHIPFLITHLGLLMILGGCLVKSSYGYQGVMSLLEGSGSDLVFFPNTEALHIESKNNSIVLALNKKISAGNLKIETVAVAPHGMMELESFIKNDSASIAGLPRIPLQNKLVFFPVTSPLASRFAAIEGIDKADAIKTILNGSSEPALLLIRDDSDHLSLVLINKYGLVSTKNLSENSLYSIERGFSGYCSKINFPKNFCELSKDDLFKEELGDIFAQNNLDYSLRHFKECCQKQNILPEVTLATFMKDWQESGAWLYPLDKPLKSDFESVMKEFSFDNLPKDYMCGAVWTSKFFKALPKEKDYTCQLAKLKEHHLQIVDNLLEQNKDAHETLTALTQKLFTLQGPTYTTEDSLEKAHLFSAILRALGLNLDTINDLSELEEDENLELLSMIQPKFTTLPASKKWEDNTPILSLKISEGDISETIQLLYDPSASELKWPVLNGKYLLRYAPLYKKIAHHVRLREGRQINYPGTNQPFSYESDIIVGKDEKTISMNNVYETADGHRFYMSSISSEEGLANRVTLAVNYDPAKYILTYPGACLLTLGIILLFWLYSNHKKKPAS